MGFSRYALTEISICLPSICHNRIMKALILAVFIFFTYSVFSQAPFKDDSSSRAVISMMNDTANYLPTVLAQFPQGVDSLQNFIKSHLIYPDVAWNDNVQGKVTCRFTVSKQGKISDIKVIKGLTLDTDSEAVRLISILPDMVPTTYHNQVEKTSSVLHISFVKPKIYDRVDQQPEFPGGEKELVRNLDRVPRPAFAGAVMGKVIFTIVVGEDGYVLYATTDKKYDPTYQPTLRAFFRTFPGFKPATLAGKPVATTISVPVQLSRHSK